MTFNDFLKIKQEQGQEALQIALKKLTPEQMKKLIIETNQALVTQLHLFVAECTDITADTNLTIAKLAKEQTESLIKRVSVK